MLRPEETGVLPKITEESFTSLPTQLSVSTTPCCPHLPLSREGIYFLNLGSHDQLQATGSGKGDSELVLNLVLKMLCIFLLVVHHLHEKTMYGLTTGPKSRGQRHVEQSCLYQWPQQIPTENRAPQLTGRYTCEPS